MYGLRYRTRRFARPWSYTAPTFSSSCPKGSQGALTAPPLSRRARSQRLQLFHHLLAMVEVGVEPAAMDELLVGPGVHDPPLIQNHDPIHAQERRAAVRRQEQRGMRGML